MKKIIIVLLLALLVMPIANACDARIISINPDKTTVTKGGSVTTEATIEFTVDALDRSWRKGLLTPSCDFLTEMSILKPQHILGMPLSIVTNRQEVQCCPGNDNFKAEYLTVECEPLEQLGCSKREIVTLTVNAPEEGYCDHCSSGTTTPTCSQDPDYYWEGAGWYTLYTAIYNGCYNDVVEQGVNFETYSTRQTSVYVSEQPIDGDGYCGDGTCGIGENWFNCSEDCPFGLPIDTTTLIWIGVVVVIAIIIVVAVYSRKK